MIKTLNFVKGAVSTKDLVPVLTSFHFYGGRVQGGNGRITIDAPLDLGGIDITVPAVPFLKAIDACDGTPKLKVTDNGRLTVSRGKFRSTLPLNDGTAFPLVTVDVTEGTLWKPQPGLLAALKTVRPFIGDDASRPWACGCLIADGYIYATNNVLMVRVPWDTPPEVRVSLPSYAVDELLRIKEEPVGFMADDSAAVFHYGDRWLRSNLFDAGWPDVAAYFEEQGELPPVPEGLVAAVEKIIPFCPDSKFPLVQLSAEGVSTAEGDMSAAVGGLDLPESKYRAETLLLALSKANAIDLARYPAPIPFTGSGGLQGVMVGVK